MIVRTSGDHLLLITQPDHAHLAATIMHHCVALTAHQRRDTIMHAIAQHDCGWAVEDASPRVDPQTGHVLDFIHAPNAVRQGVWPRCISQLEPHDPYAAALIGQHALTVYDRLRSAPDWQPFFDDITQRRDALVAHAAIPLAQLVDDYAFVRLGDLISLTVCTEDMELSQFGDWRVRRAADGAIVDPDPFGGAVVSTEIAARELPSKTYPSDAALHEALRSAPTRMLRATVRGGA
jgi:uncharacterized protein DUF3891